MLKILKKTISILCFSKEIQARIIGVKMGSDNMIASKFWSSEPYLITIGSHCQITKDVLIHTHGGGGAVRHIIKDFDAFGKVTVGDYVYIGSRSIIMPGVTIGNHVLIAGGSIVTKSIPSDVVVAGCPAQIVCTIDEYIKNNMKYNIGTKGLSRKEKKKFLQKLPDSKFIKKSLMTI